MDQNGNAEFKAKKVIYHDFVVGPSGISDYSINGHVLSANYATLGEQINWYQPRGPTTRAAAVATKLTQNGVPNTVESVGFGELQAPGDEQPDPGSRRVDVTFGNCTE